MYSFDLDPDALSASKEIQSKNFNFIHDNFRNLDNYFDNESISGAIIDCGLSSPQLDSPERGFSFQKKGPLDMRFNNQSGATCSDIVNEYKEEEISHILWTYGEEEESRRIAKAIVARRSAKLFNDTLDLSNLIKNTKRIKTKKHAATKSFQAFRMAVNDEMLNLEQCLETIKKKINIQFYVLGYLESNMTFGRKLILPKGSTKNLANVVFKNIRKKYKKIYFPFWWGFISYVLRILPFTLIERLIKFIK